MYKYIDISKSKCSAKILYEDIKSEFLKCYRICIGQK